jgi:CBS domain-containing protein
MMDDRANDVDVTPAEALAALRGGSGIAPPLLSQPLAHFIARAPISCAPETPLRAVLETMERESIGAMVIVAPDQRPLGVFTLRDVLEKAALRNVDRATPIGALMDRRLFTLSAQAHGFEAAVLMAREGVRYVLVVDGARLTGVVSESRLFAAWRGGIGDVSAAIRTAASVDQVVAATAGIHALVDRLLDEGMPAESITRAVTTLDDLVSERLIEVVGLAPALDAAGGCWIALGSEGRLEQTLATDQDNAIVFADDDDAERRRSALIEGARAVNEALARCGFPLCRGDVMASNPKWCLTFAEWRARFAQWIDEPDPQALLNATIFFDLRPIYGRQELAHALRTWLADYAQDRGRFLLPMAQNALANRPPLGLVRDFVLSGDAAHPDTLDLKINGVQLFVEAARIFGLADGVTATNTLERLTATAARRKIAPLEAEAWAEAFRFIQLLRLRQNAAQRARGEPIHNHVDPATLNDVEKRMLKEALRQARSLQSRLARDFSIASTPFGA